MFEADSFRKFLGSALSLSERGTEIQRGDIAGVAAEVAHLHGELVDIVSQQRDSKLHPHHQPKDLATVIDSGIRTLRQLAKKIDPEAELPEILPPPNKRLR